MLRTAIALSGVAIFVIPECSLAGWRDLFRTVDQPELQAVACGRYEVVSDHELAVGTAAKIACELDRLHARLERELGLSRIRGASVRSQPPDGDRPPNRIRIYLFATHEAFSRYVREHVPYLTRADMQRDALFLLRNGKPYLFTVHSDELLRNLRHEYVHLYLNDAIRGVPVWLDEGLAQFYETGDEDGRNERALAILDEALRNRWIPNLARLERLETMSELESREYAEAWSWVTAARQFDRQMIPRYLVAVKSEQSPPTFHDDVAGYGIEPREMWIAWWRTWRTVQIQE